MQQSAKLAYNEEMGGHVAQHILGMLPPWGSSQLGKTMFSEKVEYENAWRLYARVTHPKSCWGDHVLQVLDLDDPIDALSCLKADWSGGAPGGTPTMPPRWPWSSAGRGAETGS